jgi:serine/threonine-protein kinase
LSSHPTRLGKYSIVSVLGHGAMGVVYKGYDPDIRRTVAIKTIRNLDERGSEFGASAVDRFRNEAQAAGRLTHPGIVGVYDYGEDGGVAFIAMEYVEGHTLSEYQAAKIRFSDDDLISATGQLLDGLEHAHEQHVWHRDIKPANLIMTRAGRVKISDFGIARIESAGLTRTTALIGTPSYMAPEQFLGRAIDHRVDIYGAGVVLYQLLTGHLPFSGATEAVMYRVVHEPPLPPSQAEGAQRAAFYDAVIAKALAKEPDQRFANAAQFKAALLAAAGRAHIAVVSEATVIALPPQRQAPPSGNAHSTSPTWSRSSPSPAGSARSGGTPPPVSSSHWERTQPIPIHWDKDQLLKMEAALARYIGPLASVLVRRAARECHDLPSMRARLAEQVNDPIARAALLGLPKPMPTPSVGNDRSGPASSFAQSLFGPSEHGSGPGGHSIFGPSTSGNSSFGHSTGGQSTFGQSTGGQSGFGPSIGGPHSTGGQGLSDTLLEGAQRALAQRVGPIARVLVKKAAAKTMHREPFFVMLLEAVEDPVAKQKLLGELNKLA